MKNATLVSENWALLPNVVPQKQSTGPYYGGPPKQKCDKYQTPHTIAIKGRVSSEMSVCTRLEEKI